MNNKDIEINRIDSDVKKLNRMFFLTVCFLVFAAIIVLWQIYVQVFQ